MSHITYYSYSKFAMCTMQTRTGFILPAKMPIIEVTVTRSLQSSANELESVCAYAVNT